MRPLSDLSVVDLSSGIAGAYTTKLLVDAGADVTKVEPPEGDPLRRWSASGADIPADGEGPLFTHLARGKQRVAVDPDGDLAALTPLLARAGALVWSRGSRLAELPDLAPDAIRRAHPHLTVTSITPFGLTGPWADRPATDLTLQAWSGGAIGLGRGRADRAPVHVGGQIGEWLAGTYGAIGTLVSRARARRSGAGELVDLSILETLAMSLTYSPVTYQDMVGRPFRKGRALVVPGVETTKDGIVGLGVGTGQQWLDFCAMVGHPEWAEDRALFSSRAHLAPEIATWTGERTTEEILELAGLFRIPHAPVGNGESIPRTDHFVERGSIVEDDGLAAPARPYRVTPAARTDRVEPEPAEAALPFAGLRVLDLTAFWAGPLCTHILAMLGAEVIHVESTARPDGTRLLAGLRFSDPDWWERSGIFAGLNTSKQSITLDLTKEAGREALSRVIATCDVVVENFTPRVLEQLGLDVDEVRRIRPDVVMVRMPGFGLGGPWRDNPAFAFVIEDAAGLTWLTGHPDENPVSPYCVGDSNAGLHALYGLLVALEHRRTTGEGSLVEAPMVDAALNVAAEQVLEHAAFGALLQRDGNRGPSAAPQNLYLAADEDEKGRRDTWVAIAVADDGQWLALRQALGRPAWAMDDDLLTDSGRRRAHDALDDELATWCGERSAEQIVDALWPAGVPVGIVMQPHEQGTLPQLQDRGFYETLDHPVAGPARHTTLPMRFSAGPEQVLRRHAPLLGEHTDEVLRSAGLTGDEIAQLEEAGVTGRVPDAYKPKPQEQG